jgi:hypothetical protein
MINNENSHHTHYNFKIMNNNGGALSFEALIDNRQWKAVVADMSNDIKGLTNSAARETSKINDVFGQLATVAGGAFAFTQLASLPQKLIQVRGEFQQLEIAFETMLGNKGKSDALFADVVKLAATTPFGLKDAGLATKQLLAYGSASTEVIGELRMLGDIASGVSVPIGDLTYLYGTLKTQGRAYAIDIRQFAGRGIPIYAELAKVLKINKEEVASFIEQGKVGFPQIEQAFKNMTGEGGMFFNLMEKNSKSLTGLTSQLKDAIDIMFNEIGKSQEGALGDSIKYATSIVQNYEPILDVLKSLVATYGTYRAAVIATATLQGIGGTIAAAKMYLDLAKSINTAKDAQIFFNLVTGLNPYAVAAAALVGLITAVALFRDTTTEAEKAQKRMANVNDEVSTSLAGEQGKIQLLTAQIKNENVSREERNNKLRELISVHPQLLGGLTLENIATKEGTDAINGYIEARKRQIETDLIKAELDESIKRQLEAKQNKVEPGFFSTLGTSLAAAGQSSFTAGTGTNFAKDQAKQTIKLNADIAKSEEELQKKLLDRVTALQSADEASLNSGKKTSEAVKKDVKYYDDQIKSLKDNQEKATTNTEFKKLESEIKNLEAKKARITGAISKEAKAAGKAAAKEAEKSGPYGSVVYWDYIAGKAKEILDKTPVSNTGQIAKQQAILSDAEKNAADARKKLAILTFDQELEEKKKNYEVYQLWVDNLGSKAANEQFDGLITQGKSYAEYLKQQIDQFQSVHPESLSGQEQEQLVKLRVEYDDATGVDTRLEKFQKRLDGIRLSATSLTDEIQQLEKAQSELNPNDQSAAAIAERIALQSQKNDAYKERKAQLQQYLVSVAGTEERRLAIEGKYNDLSEELNAKYLNNRGAAYEEAVKKMNRDKQDEFDADNVDLATKSTEFKALTRIIAEASSEQTKVKLDAAKKQLEILKGKNAQETDEYKDQLAKIKQLEEENVSKRADNFRAYSNAVAGLADAMSGLPGAFGQIGAALSGLTSGVSNFTVAMSRMKDGKIGVEQYGAALQGVANIIGIIASSAKERKQAEEQYYSSVINQQQQYNLLLNEQIGLQSKSSGSVFYTDFEGEINDGFKKAQDAQQKGLDAMAALQNGKAKDGQKNGIDWKKVGAGAASGAAGGFIAGGGVFSWATTTVGAVGGAIVGLFGGMKKKDTFTPLLSKWPGLIDESKEGLDGFNSVLAQTLIDNNLVDEATKRNLQSTIEWKEQLKAAQEQIKGVISSLAGALGDQLRDGIVNAFREGEDAAQAFEDTVTKVLENILAQLIFSKVIGPYLDELEKRMDASSAPGGDGTWVDDFGWFFSKSKELAALNNKMMQDAKDQAANYGIDLWAPKETSKTANALSGAITGMSAAQGNVLEGQFNALRINSAEILTVERDSNSHLRNILFGITNISNNSNYLPLLASIDKKLDYLQKADTFDRAYGGS